MTLLALEFMTPWLLLGLLAAAIPVVIHLLASVRAPEVYFPTLRFLHLSMEKTAHRRRLQHWLLLLLRSLLLAMLAVGVAQVIIRNGASLWGADKYAAVMVLDNSYSMEVAEGGTTRFERAKRQAMALLDGDHKPALAAMMLSNEDTPPTDLVSDLSQLRKHVEEARVGAGRAPIAQRVGQAIALLGRQGMTAKRIYIFSDLQEASFADLLSLPELKNRQDVHLMVVNAAGRAVENVGITNLEIAGRRVTDQALTFTVTLVNSSPATKRVTATLTINGETIGTPQTVSLKGSNEKGAGPVNVKFYHPFTTPGSYSGQVTIDSEDDLPIDNLRRFSVDIAERVNVLIVAGPPADAPHNDGGVVLSYALDPRGDSSTRWSIRPRLVRHTEFKPADLSGMDAVFCADVPTFTPEQAAALVDFTRKGGTTVFFMGDHVIPSSAPRAAGGTGSDVVVVGGHGSGGTPGYNELFVDNQPPEEALLPARLVRAVGEVGLSASAQAMDWVALTHPYFEGLCKQHSDYQKILTQRYFLTEPAGSAVPQTLMRLQDGAPLLLEKPLGEGRAILCTSSASLEWTKLPSMGLFLFVPMLERMSLQARAGREGGNDYLQGARVAIRVPTGVAEGTQLDVTRPDSTLRPATVRKAADGLVAEFSDTQQLGLYRWKARGGGEATAQAPGGSFTINPDGTESQLAAMPPERLVNHLGPQCCVVAPTVAGADQAAAQAAAGMNLSDLFLILVILLLVVEAQIANRFRRRQDEAVPAHLNPRIAG